MWDEKQIAPVYGANLVGGNFVVAVHAANPSIAVGNSGSTALPSPGDIISMWGGSSGQTQNGGNSHVAVVTQITGTASSGWTITVMEENGSSNGWSSVSVSANGARWSTGSGYFTSFDWLKLGDSTPPTPPGRVQVTPAANGSNQATLSWSGSNDSGGSGLAGYLVQLNGTTVASSLSPAATSYTFSSLNCTVENTFAVVAVDGAGNTSPPAAIANQILVPCVKLQALNHIVSVSGGASYYDDSGGLHSLDDQNTYWCLVDQGKPVYAVSQQAIANVLGNGRPTYPECLSLQRLYGHTVRNSQTGAAYIVTNNNTPHGVWHWEQSGGVYQCLLGAFPLLNADTAEIESLRSNGFYNGANADCPPSPPSSLAISSSSQGSIGLSWRASANDDGYTVLVNGAPVGSTSNTGYSVSGLSCSSSYTLGVRATNVVGLNSPTVTMVGSTAACPPKYTLSVSLTGTGSGFVGSSPGGISCGGTCSVQFTQGTVVTLNAGAPGGSALWSWSGACGGTQTSCTVTMNGNVSVSANFAAIYTIQSLANGKYVTAELGYGGNDYGLLRARTSPPSFWERFTIVGDCNNACAFVSFASRYYVSAELGYGGNSYGELRARSPGWGGWETFHLVGNCAASCAIVSNPTGKYVSAELLDPGGYYARLRARSSRWGGWESFRIVRG